MTFAENGAVRAGPIAAGVLAELEDLIAPMFARPEPREQAIQYVTGLLGGIGKANSWQIAKENGERLPWRTQRLLNRAHWDAAAVRDALRRFLRTRIGHRNGVLVVSEGAVPKKGHKTVGVERQYADAVGQVANCQVVTHAGYVSPFGSSVVDYDLFLPTSWTEDTARCEQAGVPAGRIHYKTKGELAKDMVSRSETSGLEFGCVVGGGDLGRDSRFRAWLTAHRIPSVLQVPGNHLVGTNPAGDASAHANVDRADQRLWCREPGGLRWLRVDVAQPENRWFEQSLLAVRRPGSSRMSYFLTNLAPDVRWPEVAYAIEAQHVADRCVELAQDEVGLADYEVRTWPAWYRHVTLALLAHSALMVEQPQRTQHGHLRHMGREHDGRPFHIR
jgi:SRSO17 transposase